MALSLLLDEQMSPQVAVQLQAKLAEIAVASVQTWRDGALRGQPDEALLRAAREEGKPLVTYDVSTITPLLVEWGATGEVHACVIFIDNFTIAQGDLGRQVQALLQQWEATRGWDWTNIVVFLRPLKNWEGPTLL